MEVSKEIKEVMTRYLLGTATSVEQEALEDRYAAAPEVFEQLVAVENDLADRYACRALSAAEQTAYERHVLAHPQRRARAEFAAALVNKVDETTAPQRQAVQASLSERWLDWWRATNFSFGLSLAMTAATLLLALGGWWFWRATRKPVMPPDLAHQTGLPVAPTATPAVATSPAPALSVTPSVTPAPPTPALPTNAVPAFVTLTLNAGLVRSTENNDTPTLTIPSGTEEVRLRLKAETTGYARYRLRLQRADGPALRNLVMPAKSNTFAVNLPARLFTEGEYVIALSGLNPNGEADALSKTIFRVTKK